MGIRIPNKKNKTSHTAIVDKNMKTHADDPFFIKKAEEASAFIKKNGLPPGFGKTKIA
jgi:hypothetical protein